MAAAARWPGVSNGGSPVLDLSASPGVTVAAIEPSVSISDYGGPREARQPLLALESESIGEVNFRGTVASFTFTNPTREDLPALRVGVVCYDSAGAIIGGGYGYPNLAPVGKAIRIDATVKTSSEPVSCKAFPTTAPDSHETGRTPTFPAG